MCSILEDDNEEMIRVSVKEVTESDLCRKCQTNQAKIILRAKDLYCRPCFLIYFIHKFRSTIGKSKEIKCGDKILIGLSGGYSSMALLRLIQQGLMEDTPKKLQFDPSVLFIDESVLHHGTTSINTLWPQVQKLNFPFYYIPFEDVFKNESSELSVTYFKESHSFQDVGSLKCNIDLQDKLDELLSTSLKSQTSREDMISNLRNELLCRCARQLGFKKVFLGTSGTALAVQILADIALGRGSQLGDHVPFKTRHFGVEVFRPMRELLNDEIKHFIQIQDISITEASELKKDETSPSIFSCTQNFLCGLQKEFVSTIPTVFKTGGKFVSAAVSSKGSVVTIETTTSTIISAESLSPFETSNRRDKSLLRLDSNETALEADLCLLCGFGKDRSDETISASKSIRVSKALSTKKRGDAILAQEPKLDTFSDSPLNVFSRLTMNGSYQFMEEESFLEHFCYGCANLFVEVNNVGKFPPRVEQRLRETCREEKTLPFVKDCST